MRHPLRIVWVVLTVRRFTGACGNETGSESGGDSGGDSLAGTYECRLEGETEPPISTIELQDTGQAQLP